MKTVTLTATGLTYIGPNHDRMVGGWILQVSGIAGGSVIQVRKKLPESVVSNAAAPLFDLEDMMDYTTVDKGTGITANGQYKVVCDLSALILDYTHGSGTTVVELESFLG